MCVQVYVCAALFKLSPQHLCSYDQVSKLNTVGPLLLFELPGQKNSAAKLSSPVSEY